MAISAYCRRVAATHEAMPIIYLHVGCRSAAFIEGKIKVQRNSNHLSDLTGPAGVNEGFEGQIPA
jgi:hypothetical protein